MLGSPVLAARIKLVHLNTTDARGVANMGALDWGNVSLGIRHLFGLVGMIVKYRPDVVLLTASQGRLALLRDALFVLVARVFRRRVATYLRGSGYAAVRARQGLMAGRALRYILKASARVLVLGKSLVPMAQAVYPEARVAVVPNGCPPAVAPDLVGTREEHHPLVAYLGALSRTKGIDDLLGAAQEIAVRVPGVEFLLCGEWSPAQYRLQVEDLVEKNGLAPAVSFPGPQAGEEKATLLARAWVLVVPSPSEGQPWVILEAMSAGTPVVATDTGAIPETVADGQSGFVVAVGDREALARSITVLLENTPLRERMSRESARRYQERFTLEHSHAALAAVLEEAARGA